MDSMQRRCLYTLSALLLWAASSATLAENLRLIQPTLPFGSVDDLKSDLRKQYTVPNPHKKVGQFDAKFKNYVTEC